MAAFAFGAGRHARRPAHLVGGAANWGATLIHDCFVQPMRAVVISIGDRAWYREHCVKRRAGNEKRLLVRFNALLYAPALPNSPKDPPCLHGLENEYHRRYDAPGN